MIDGTLSFIISHPKERFARETVATMMKAKTTGPDAGAHQVMFGVDIYTPESTRSLFPNVVLTGQA